MFAFCVENNQSLFPDAALYKSFFTFAISSIAETYPSSVLLSNLSPIPLAGAYAFKARDKLSYGLELLFLAYDKNVPLKAIAWSLIFFSLNKSLISCSDPRVPLKIP